MEKKLEKQVENSKNKIQLELQNLIQHLMTIVQDETEEIDSRFQHEKNKINEVREEILRIKSSLENIPKINEKNLIEIHSFLDESPEYF